SGTLSPPNSTDLYQFTANAGDQYNFLAQGGSADNTSWRLLDPYGNVLFNAVRGTNSGPLNLTATGRYSLLVEGGIVATGTGTYAFTAQFVGNMPPAPPTGTALTLGSTVDGSLITAGQQDRYIFHLA